MECPICNYREFIVTKGLVDYTIIPVKCSCELCNFEFFIYINLLKLDKCMFISERKRRYPDRYISTQYMIGVNNEM